MSIENIIVICVLQMMLSAGLLHDRSPAHIRAGIFLPGVARLRATLRSFPCISERGLSERMNDMIRIKEEKIVSVKDGVACVDAELIVSSARSLPEPDGIDGRELVPGSIAVVPDDSSIYVLGFGGEWKEWGDES